MHNGQQCYASHVHDCNRIVNGWALFVVGLATNALLHNFIVCGLSNLGMNSNKCKNNSYSTNE